MQSIIMFGDGFAYISSGRRGGKKKLSTVAVGKHTVKNGEILGPETAAKKIMAQLKKDKIQPKEVIFVLRSSDVVITDLTTPIVSRKMMKQSVKVGLNEKYPGVMDNNYIVYKTYGVEEDTYRVMAAMAPKNTISSYCKVAEVMKCRLRRIDLYQNCALKKLGEKHAGELDAGAIIVDMGREVTLLNYVQSGAVAVSNSFAPVTLASGDENRLGDVAASQLRDQISYIVSAVGAEEISALYIKNNAVIDQEQFNQLVQTLEEQFEFPAIVLDKMFGDTPHELLSAAVVMKKGLGGDFDFTSELDISDGRNFESADVVLAIAAGAAAAVVLTIAGYGALQYSDNLQLQQTIAIDQAFIEANRPIEQLYRQEVLMGQEVGYLQTIDAYIDETKYDFVAIERQIEKILADHSNNFHNVSIHADMSLSINGDAARYSDIAGVMTDLKQAGYVGVSVVSVTPGDRDLPGDAAEADGRIKYQLFAKYVLAQNTK